MYLCSPYSATLTYNDHSRLGIFVAPGKLRPHCSRHCAQRGGTPGILPRPFTQPGRQFGQLGPLLPFIRQGQRCTLRLSWLRRRRHGAVVSRLFLFFWCGRCVCPSLCPEVVPRPTANGGDIPVAVEWAAIPDLADRGRCLWFKGALTAVATNPVWVIKTRMLSTSSRHPGAYTSLVDGARQIWRSEGLRGFYRGLIPSLFGVGHGALQFMAYEQLKRSRGLANSNGQTRQLSNVDYLALSATSKVFAGVLTYPYQVLRARLQTYDARNTYKGVFDVVRQVLRREGPLGFYKGLTPNIVRVLPSTCVTFLVYENVRSYLPAAWSNFAGCGENAGRDQRR